MNKDKLLNEVFYIEIIEVLILWFISLFCWHIRFSSVLFDNSEDCIFETRFCVVVECKWNERLVLDLRKHEILIHAYINYNVILFFYLPFF